MGYISQRADPLSDVLSLLSPRNSVSAAIEAGGDWSIEFPPEQGLRFQAVVSGHCWLVIEGVPEAVRMDAGQCCLLPDGRRFRIASDPSLAPVDAYTILAQKQDGVASINGGGSFLGMGCFFTLSARHAHILLKLLPPLVSIRGKAEQAVLQWSLTQMVQEQREKQPGSFLLAQHLAHIMLIQALRLYVAEASSGGSGWLFALADKQMSVALAAMHSDPAHRWTLQLLAQRAGMSRTSFALRFKETVGVSAMEYLTRWRMLRAQDMLESSGDPVSVIALSLGYESESAFAAAFKRETGSSPRQYSRSLRDTGKTTRH